MYRVIIDVTITQQPSKTYPNRSKVLNLSFLTDYSITSTWKNFTDTGTIVIPKNLYYKSDAGEVLPLSGKNINIGGFTDYPLFLRGDKIVIKAGYRYGTIKDLPTLFVGYITKVNAKMPIELGLEDNMWLLKQKALKPKTFSVSDGLESILDYILDGTGFTHSVLTKTTFGGFVIQNETPAQVLDKLQRLMNINAYFRENDLRCGVLTYVATDMVKHIFDFNVNIIEDNLQYQRKDDIKLSAVAYNYINENVGGTTQDGSQKTKKKRISVLVEMLPEGGYKETVITSGSAPQALEGERRTFFFIGAQTTSDLTTLAVQELEKYMYTGYKGYFVTFGIPFVKHGDNVELRNKQLPEMNGTYKVKEVRYLGAMQGLRQEVELDYKILG